MPKSPPLCYICNKSCDTDIENCVYCICDITICSNCLNSVKKNDKVWICPKCHSEHDIQNSKLIRNQ